MLVCLWERLRQSFVNAAVLVRFMRGSISSDPVLSHNGVPFFRPDTPVSYYGNSQGGVVGGAYVTMSPDIRRAVMGETGAVFAAFLTRSKDFLEFYDYLQLQIWSERDFRIFLCMMSLVRGSCVDGWPRSWAACYRGACCVRCGTRASLRGGCDT